MTSTVIDLEHGPSGWYAATATPTMVDVPEAAFLMVDGHGDPNTAPDYRDAVSALYTLSYAIHFALKRAGPGEHRVLPLEGLWWSADPSAFLLGAKADWDWTMMVRQPDDLPADLLADARSRSEAKAPPALDRVRLERFTEGRCAQILHRGPYSAEGPTIAALHDYIHEQGYELTGKHHEIYLGDPRRAAPERLRTILRQPVRRPAEAPPTA